VANESGLRSNKKSNCRGKYACLKTSIARDVRGLGQSLGENGDTDKDRGRAEIISGVCAY